MNTETYNMEKLDDLLPKIEDGREDPKKWVPIDEELGKRLQLTHQEGGSNLRKEQVIRHFFKEQTEFYLKKFHLK